MKKFLTLFAAAICSLTALAQKDPAFSPLSTDGETVQYLYNVDAKAFFLGANDWQTRASVSREKGYKVKVATTGSSTYSLTDYVEKFSDWRKTFADSGTSIWVDNNAGANCDAWEINQTGRYTFTIANSAAATGLLGVDPTLADSRLYINETVAGTTWAAVSESDYAAWQQAVADSIANLKKTTVVGADITQYTDLSNSSIEGWTLNNNSIFHVNTWSTEGNSDGSGMVTPFLENWVAAGSLLPEGIWTYSIDGLVPGQKYQVSALVRAYNEGTADVPTGAYLYCGDEHSADISTLTSSKFNGKPLVYGTLKVEGQAGDDGVLLIGLVEANNNFNWIAMRDVKVSVGHQTYTDYIVNNLLDQAQEKDVVPEKGWNTTNTKGIEGGMCKVSSGKTFDFCQTITIPAGEYKMRAQAAYRYGDNEQNEYNSIAAGEDTHYAKLYAKVGNEEVSENVKNRWEGASDVAYGNSCVEINGKYVPNSSADVLTYMNAGQYNNEIVFNVLQEGPVTIGIKKSENPSVSDYTVIGAWTLERLGDPDPTAAIKSNIAAAQELIQQNMNKDLKEELITLIDAATFAVETMENIETVNTALKEKIAEAQANIKAYENAANVLPQMKKLVESTNVYTKDALDAYYTTPAANYEAGIMTTSEAEALQNPYSVTGWHASITCDNLLLSSWNTNPDFQDAPYYINTWSVEGETDGSEFRVPFFEYWTGDANSLGEKTLTATVDNLPAGKYDVSAWVRVRLNNNSTDQQAYGITFNANDGQAVDACAGNQVGETQFRMMEVKAQGEVGADGVLKINFNVAKDNNISWLSFQNVNYAAHAPELVSTITAKYKQQPWGASYYDGYFDETVKAGMDVTVEKYDNNMLRIKNWFNTTNAGYDDYNTVDIYYHGSGDASVIDSIRGNACMGYDYGSYYNNYFYTGITLADDGNFNTYIYPNYSYINDDESKGYVYIMYYDMNNWNWGSGYKSYYLTFTKPSFTINDSEGNEVSKIEVGKVMIGSKKLTPITIKVDNNFDAACGDTIVVTGLTDVVTCSTKIYGDSTFNVKVAPKEIETAEVLLTFTLGSISKDILVSYVASDPINEIVALQNGDAFIADDYTDAGTTAVTAGTYMYDNKVYSPTGNNVATNKKSSEINGESHLNSLRVKGAQQYIVFKSGVTGKVTVYGNSDSRRCYVASNSASFADGGFAKTDAGDKVFTFDVTEGQVVYLSSINVSDGSNGDMFIAGFTVEGVSTAINSAANEASTSKAGKFIENNRVVIIKNGKKYNVAGALLK